MDNAELGARMMRRFAAEVGGMLLTLDGIQSLERQDAELELQAEPNSGASSSAGPSAGARASAAGKPPKPRPAAPAAPTSADDPRSVRVIVEARVPVSSSCAQHETRATTPQLGLCQGVNCVHMSPSHWT